MDVKSTMRPWPVFSEIALFMVVKKRKKRCLKPYQKLLPEIYQHILDSMAGAYNEYRSNGINFKNPSGLIY